MSLTVHLLRLKSQAALLLFSFSSPLKRWLVMMMVYKSMQIAKAWKCGYYQIDNIFSQGQSTHSPQMQVYILSIIFIPLLNN